MRAHDKLFPYRSAVELTDAETRAFTFHLLGVELLRAHGDWDRIPLTGPTGDIAKSYLSVGDAAWGGGPLSASINGFIHSTEEINGLDQVGLYASQLPPKLLGAVVASGWVGDAMTEGAPKPVKNPSLVHLFDEAPRKVVAMSAFSSDLIQDPRILTILRREVEAATVRAANASVAATALAQTGSPTLEAGTATTDAFADLTRLVAALPATEGIVVFAPSSRVAALSLRVEALPGFGLRGGTFKPGLSIVVCDSLPAHVSMLAIAASRCALTDYGMRVVASKQATLQLIDTPVTPIASTVQTSLFQEGLVALLVERQFHLLVPAGCVAVVGA